jgi:hypothetical protein
VDIVVVEHYVLGEKETTWHDFQITVAGLAVTVSSGSYYRNNELLYESIENTTLTIATAGYYEIWLTTNGFELLFDITNIQNPIDRLAWINAGSTEVTEIDVIKIIGL